MQSPAGTHRSLAAPSTRCTLVKDVLKPIGQWNYMRLIVRPNNRAEHWMNGEKICEYTIGSDNWNERVANSKFSSMPRFGKSDQKSYLPSSIRSRSLVPQHQDPQTISERIRELKTRSFELFLVAKQC